MGKKTGIIKYNLADRMRKHRGQDRNFDIPAAVRLLNGGSVQERIKMGDMHGFFGHWPRVKFGLDPDEGGFVDGKQVSLEPAVRTTYLKAFPDGMIEYENEFLDTNSGKIAERIYGSKAYGFSSAIDAKRVGGALIPTGFFGFDFVKEPNYTENRGYAIALDGVYDAEDVLDAVAERDALFDTVNTLLDDAARASQAVLDEANANHKRSLEALDAVTLENEELMCLLLKKKAEAESVLDGCADLIGMPKTSILFQAEAFLDQVLTPYNKTDEQAAPSPTKEADRLLGRHFRN